MCSPVVVVEVEVVPLVVVPLVVVVPTANIKHIIHFFIMLRYLTIRNNPKWFVGDLTQ